MSAVQAPTRPPLSMFGPREEAEPGPGCLLDYPNVRLDADTRCDCCDCRMVAGQWVIKLKRRRLCSATCASDGKKTDISTRLISPLLSASSVVAKHYRHYRKA